MPKVLIIEPEWGLGLLYKEELAEVGIDSVYITNFDEALFLLSNEIFDLIILEPRSYKDPAEGYNQIRQKYEQIPIIVSTHYPDVAIAENHENYWIKSADLTGLILMVCRLLSIDTETIQSKISPKRQVKIFICYAKEDLNKANAIYNRLIQLKFNPWIDNRKLVPGQDWELEIEKAIDACNFFLACLSSHSVTKEGYVQKELKKGLEILDRHPEGRIYLIPLRLDDCKVPKRFERIQWCDLFKTDGMVNLLRSIVVGCEQQGIRLENI
jgi:CheY-like chemotaxis protein